MEADRKEFLRNILVEEIFKTMGLNPNSVLRPIGDLLTRRPTTRLTKIALEVNDELERGSLNSAFAMLLELFSDPPILKGIERVPAKGPLLLTANHPGTVDTAALLSSVPRDDTKIIAGYTPFTENLENLREHLIFSSQDTQQRMSVARESIRHMRNGGCLLLYPAGALEPDPAIMPGAINFMDNWHRSVELFVKKVPGVVVSPIVVSHILHDRFFSHFLAKRRKTTRDRQRTAEMLQIISQIVNRDKHALTPRITFGEALTLDELVENSKGESLFDSIKKVSRDLMYEHVSSFEHNYPALEIVPA